MSSFFGACKPSKNNKHVKAKRGLKKPGLYNRNSAFLQWRFQQAFPWQPYTSSFSVQESVTNFPKFLRLDFWFVSIQLNTLLPFWLFSQITTSVCLLVLFYFYIHKRVLSKSGCSVKSVHLVTQAWLSLRFSNLSNVVWWRTREPKLCLGTIFVELCFFWTMVARGRPWAIPCGCTCFTAFTSIICRCEPCNYIPWSDKIPAAFCTHSEVIHPRA